METSEIELIFTRNGGMPTPTEIRYWRVKESIKLKIEYGQQPRETEDVSMLFQCKNDLRLGRVIRLFAVVILNP